MSLKKIISGGQTGADIAGIDAAIEHGMSYGGWLPKGRKTEKGPLDLKYTNMTEMSVGDYPEMTEQNVKDSDGTVIFTHGKYSGVSALTSNYAVKHNKPVLHVDLDVATESAAIESLIEWIYIQKIETLNVAGSRESKDEYIYDDVHSILKSIIDTIKTAEILQKPQPPPTLPSLQETLIATPHSNDTAAPERKEADKAFHIPPQETTAALPPTPQTSPPIQPQEALVPSSQVTQKEVAAERDENKESVGVLGLAFLIERLPKTVKKNLVYITLGTLILTIALMIIPGGVKNHSPENTTKKSLPFPEDRVSKTTGFSSNTIPAAGRAPESGPPNASALPTTADSTKEAGIPPLPLDSKPSLDSQAKSSENNPDIKTDNPSIAVEQMGKNENEQKAAPVNDSIDTTHSNNGDTNGTLQSLSDTSGETETIEPSQVPPKKKPSKSRYNCKSLYKKISLGEVLDKAETEFLAHNCN